MSKENSKIKEPHNAKVIFPIHREGKREKFLNKTLECSFSFTKKTTKIENKIISKSVLDTPNKVKTLRYKISPNEFLRERFQECFDFSTFVYNKCVDDLNSRTPDEIKEKTRKEKERLEKFRDPNFLESVGAPEAISEEEIKDLEKKVIKSEAELMRLVGKPENFEETKEKYSSVPADITSHLIREFASIRSTCFESLRLRRVKYFEIKHRSKEETYQESFYMRKQYLTPKPERNFVFLFKKKWSQDYYPEDLKIFILEEEKKIEDLEEKLLKMRKSKTPGTREIQRKIKLIKEGIKKKTLELVTLKLPWDAEKFELKHDCKIVRTFDDKYFIDVPVEIDCHRDGSKNELNFETIPNQKIDVIALDPGVRTFLTGYDSNGNVLTFGEKKDIQHIRQKRMASDWLQKGFFVKFDKKKRVFVQKGLITNKYLQEKNRILGNKMMRNCKNEIKTFHHRVAKYLLDNYNNIIIPEFKSSNTNKKKGGNRKIGKDTVKALSVWSHFEFRQILLTKGKNKGVQVHLGSEEYTTQTCGYCFEKHKEIGSNKSFVCPNEKCDLKYPMDRDVLEIFCFSIGIGQN